MKPAILFLEQQSWRGGAQRVLEEVLRALREDFRCIVALPEDGPFALDLRAAGVETLTFPLGRYRSGRKSLADIARFAVRTVLCALRLARAIVQIRPRLVYINGPRWLPSGAVAARLTGTPSLFHLHRTFVRGADLFVVTRAARHASRIVACSESAASALLRAEPALAKRTTVLLNPVPPAGDSKPDFDDEPAVAKTSGEFVVGMVGRITREKGHDVLLRAAGALRRQDVQLVFVGAPEPGSMEDTSYLAELRELSQELGLEKRTLWAGYQSKLGPYYESFDALVIPSVASEGLPMVALEAMQQGVPVIGSRIEGNSEVVRDGVNGLLFPPGDPKALAASLQRILEDSAFHAKLRAGARATIDGRFSVKTFRSAIRRVVSELCTTTVSGKAGVLAQRLEARP